MLNIMISVWLVNNSAEKCHWEKQAYAPAQAFGQY